MSGAFAALPGDEAKDAFQVDELTPLETSTSSDERPPSFERYPVLLRYKDNALERDFVTARCRTGEYRFLCLCLAMSLSGILYAIQQVMSGTGDRAALMAGVASIVTVVLEVILMRPFVDSFLTRHNISTAAVREIVCVIFLLAIAGNLSYIAAIGLESRDCNWLMVYDDRPLFSPCSKRIHGIWFLIGLLPIIIGRPRLLYVTLQLVLSFALTLVVDFEKVGSRVVASWVSIALLYTLFCWFLKFIDERRHRTQFELQLTLACRVAKVERADMHLHEFVLSIAPKHMHRRLRILDATAPVDSSRSAIVIYVNIHDATNFVSSMLPAQAAVAMVMLLAHTRRHGELCGLTQVAATADTSILVGNLFGAPVSLAAAVKCALDIVSSFPSPIFVPRRCGIAMGGLVGAPLGSSSIRFDVYGPALLAATQSVFTCPALRVKVQADLVERLSSRFAFADESDPCLVTFERVARPQDAAEQGENDPHRPGTPSADPHDNSIVTIAADSTADKKIVASAAGDGRSSRSSSNADGLVNLIPYLTRDEAANKAAADLSRGSGAEDDLELSQTMCLWRTFDSDVVASEQIDHRRRLDRLAFALCCFFFTVFFAVVIAVIVVERYDSVDAPLKVSLAILGATVIGFGCLFASVVRSASTLSTTHFLICVVLLVAQLIGATLSRSSMAGDDISYAVVSGVVALPFCGGTVQQTFAAQLLLLVVYLILAFAFRPLILVGIVVYAPVFHIAIMIISIQRDAQMKKLFVNEKRAERALLRLDAHRALRTAVVDGLIPRQLQHRLTVAARKSNQLNAWNVDDCLVMAIRFDELLGVDPERFVAAPQEWASRTAAAVDMVMTALRATPHHTLEVVRVFGGRVLIAGPLDEMPKVQPDQPPSRDNRIVKAAEDAFFLANALLHSGIKVSAGMANEQAINTLHHGDFPTHNIVGPAVRTAYYLMEAAPQGCIAATERLVSLYRRECEATMPVGSIAIAFGSTTPWRILGAGTVRVCTLRPGCTEGSIAPSDASSSPQSSPLKNEADGSRPRWDATTQPPPAFDPDA